MFPAQTSQFRPGRSAAGARVFVAAIACLAFGAACAGGEPSAEATPPGEGAARTPVAYPLTEVGASADDAELGSVSALDVDSRGRIYVGDRMNGQVFVFSPSGALLRTVGAKGEGPGEFKSVTDVQVLPGDSLQVYDMQLARLTTFAPESDEVASVSTLVSPGASAPPFFVRRLGRDGSVLAGYRRAFSPTDDPREDAGRSEVVRLLGADGRVLRDGVLTLRGPDMLVSREGGAVSVRQNPFGRKGILRVDPRDRIVYLWTDTASVEIYSPEGERVGGFSVAHRSPEVTRQEIEDAVGKGGNRMRRLLSESAPERWPAVRDMVVDDRGRVWIALAAPSGAPVEWAAFEESGRYAGSVMLPPEVQLRVVRGDLAYAVAKDELDVPRVVVYRLDPRLG